MNKTQKQLVAELRREAFERPSHFTDQARAFLSDMADPYRQRKRINYSAHEWLARLGRTHLGKDHPLVVGLKMR